MKIAQIVCAYPPYAGGIGNSAKQIFEILKDKHEVINFTPDNTKPLWRKGHGAILLQLLWRLRKFDYIYLHYPFFGTAEIIWLFKSFYFKPKLIIHYHMDVQNLSLTNKILAGPSKLIRTSLLKKADFIITASLDYIKNSQIKNFYASNPEKFKEIPFAVDLNKFKPKDINLPSNNKILEKTKNLIKQVTNLFIKRDRLDLIFVGGLDKAHYFKGVDILLTATSLLRHKNWHLKIVGEGDLLSDYQNQVKQLKIEKQVEFLGKLSGDELIKNLQSADALILPSINKNEAFGIVLIEALACGVPVIASDLPGVRKVFEDKKEGLLFEPKNPVDLNIKLDFLAQNEKKRKEMAKEARKLAERKYDLIKMKQSYENLFIK